MRLAIDGMMLVPAGIVLRRVLAHTVMKQLLLLLTFMAVASQAMAQDGQCVLERTAMVETIRAYARFAADVLGPQGISERVLQVMGQTERHRFIPERSCLVAYMDAPVLIGHDQTMSQPFIVGIVEPERSEMSHQCRSATATSDGRNVVPSTQ